MLCAHANSGVHLSLGLTCISPVKVWSTVTFLIAWIQLLWFTKTKIVKKKQKKQTFMLLEIK